MCMTIFATENEIWKGTLVVGYIVRASHATRFACNKLGEVETEMVRVTHAHPPQGLDEMGEPQGPPAREGGKEGGRAGEQRPAT